MNSLVLDFNKKEEFALNYFANFLRDEFHLSDEGIEAFENYNSNLIDELVSELKKPLDNAEYFQALLGKTIDYPKQMNGVLLQYYMDIEETVEKTKNLERDDMERQL